MTHAEFIALDPTLGLLHANGLVVNTLATFQRGGWRYRVNPGDPVETVYFDTAGDAAYARYLAIQEGA